MDKEKDFPRTIYAPEYNVYPAKDALLIAFIDNIRTAAAVNMTQKEFIEKLREVDMICEKHPRTQVLQVRSASIQEANVIISHSWAALFDKLR